VLRQDRSKSELIVVDNDRADRTREVAWSFGATVVHEAVHNISRVRNAGASVARGDILAFVDADTGRVYRSPSAALPGMGKKLDLAENTRYYQAVFEGAMPTLRGKFLRDVTSCYAPVRAAWSSAAMLLRFHTDPPIAPISTKSPPTRVISGSTTRGPMARRLYQYWF
jgi:glycosyltransferase involved in cell wall biosynthesis